MCVRAASSAHLNREQNDNSSEQQLDGIETHMPHAALPIPPWILNPPRRQPKVARHDPNHKEVTTNDGPQSWSHLLKDKCSRCSGERHASPWRFFDAFLWAARGTWQELEGDRLALSAWGSEVKRRKLGRTETRPTTQPYVDLISSK